MKHVLKSLFATGILSISAAASPVPAQAADIMPLVDAHLHYSHDAWDDLPSKDAIAVLRRAGLKKAFVSSSSY
jgi:hypothetical protein